MRSSLIFTFSRSYNFGASLQAFSLQRVIRKLGSECKIVDTRSEEEMKGHIEYRKDAKGRILNIFTYLNKSKILKGKEKFNSFNYSSEDRLRLPAVQGVPEVDKIEAMGQLADVYVVGSDQVFSPMMMSKLYFLQFNTGKAKCISYAASIGISEVPKDKEKLMKAYLEKFDAVSVREASAKVALQPFVNEEIQIHLDPTLLTGRKDWERVEKEYTPLLGKKYILAYFLYRPADMNTQLKRMHKETGLPVILIDTSAFRNIYHQKIVLDAGPQEFLWLVHHAEMIITSSFHGTAMSIIYGKPFVVYNNPATPARIEQLLNLTGLQNHWVKSGTGLKKDDFAVSEKEIEEAYRLIEREKEKSLNYLYEWLSD